MTGLQKRQKSASNLKYKKKNRKRLLIEAKKYYLKNKSRICAYQKEYRKSNPEIISNYKKENRLAIRRSWRKYYKKHYKRLMLYKKTYRDLNREKINSYAREYSKTHAAQIFKYRRKNKLKAAIRSKRSEKKNYDKRRQRDHLRRAMISKPVSRARIRKMVQDTKNCVYCKRSIVGLRFHLDHAVPLKRGGKHHISNIVVSCKRCNLTKRDKTIPEFIAYAKVVGYKLNVNVKAIRPFLRQCPNTKRNLRSYSF